MRYGLIGAFTLDLSGDQRRLCAWVAERASEGIRRIHYSDVKAALGFARDRDLTRCLKEIRERVDDVHKMVHFPIVNTTSPYFDIDVNAGYIWDDYCRAEQESAGADCGNQSHEVAITDDSECRPTVCAV
ncbi:MAG: hypothetical protein JSW27_20660 [Phycisphaerales bacterium]|nr:MAG: hypothetical protein JSW27_20660 [Phycisphaerales bacterium]